MTDLPLIVLIPVRAGSKGLPGKNIRPLAGKPLYRHAVDQGLAAGAELCLISTDIPEILATDQGPGVQVLPRPADLAGDRVAMDPVLLHALRAGFAGPARVVLLQATSPLRQVADIRAAVEVHKRGGFDLVMSVTPAPATILKYGMADGDRFIPVARPDYCFMNRQALPPVFRPNGAVYVFSADWLRANGGLATDSIGMVEMPAERSLDIDGPEDFARAEAALRGA